MSVSVSAYTPEVSACHCRLCRVWSGAVQMGFEAPVDAVHVRGDVRRYRATPFSERAFCPTCGTALWLKDDTGGYEFVPGLFDGARELPLVREVYADRAFACVPLAGTHPRVSRADYERINPHVEGDTP
ncbi:hypothetical protein roselon_01018 [Roseibacterium elongatum DSM 19469]|uniref:CENP-V/GFA domain-containing protein n=1 Tax=Roseicyclus elongatus DSM 19469 TaxID=1294273 RepID=W8RQU5_9RHOB|nr:hypothetical protein roselon_01018 [Roseibacterium elongatum DSM 19469]